MSLSSYLGLPAYTFRRILLLVSCLLGVIQSLACHKMPACMLCCVFGDPLFPTRTRYGLVLTNGVSVSDFNDYYGLTEAHFFSSVLVEENVLPSPRCRESSSTPVSTSVHALSPSYQVFATTGSDAFGELAGCLLCAVVLNSVPEMQCHADMRHHAPAGIAMKPRMCANDDAGNSYS